MCTPKNVYRLNKWSVDTSVSEVERETAGVTGEWKGQGVSNVPPTSQVIESRDLHDGQQDSFSIVQNRSVDASLPVQKVQLPGVLCFVNPSLTFGCRQVADQRSPCSTDKSAKILDIQEEVEMGGNEFGIPEIPAKKNRQPTDEVREALVKTIDIGTVPKVCFIDNRIFTEYQQSELEKSFQKNPHPTVAERNALADKLGVDRKRVTFWFHNKRSRVKNKLLKSTIFASLTVSDQSSNMPDPSEVTIKRFRFSASQIKVLTQCFGLCKRLTNQVLAFIMKETGLLEKQVKMWFVTARRKRKKSLLESEVNSNKLPLEIGEPRRIKSHFFGLSEREGMEERFKDKQNITIEEAALLAKEYNVTEATVMNLYRYKRIQSKTAREGGDAGSFVASSKEVLDQSGVPLGQRAGESNTKGIKKKYYKYTKEQLFLLNKYYRINEYPRPAEKRAIALELNCQETRIDFWFKNRRRREKTKNLKIENAKCSKKVVHDVLDIASANLSSNKTGEAFSGFQVKKPPHKVVKLMPATALGAVSLPSAERERADAELLLNFSRSLGGASSQFCTDTTG